MIVSHKHRFIFIKTSKTAGSSIEMALANICSDDDILTPIVPSVPGHTARNWEGRPNLLKEITQLPRVHWRSSIKHFIQRKRFVNHLPAEIIKTRITERVWKNYFKFCFECDPFDKVASHFLFLKQRKRFDGNLEQFLSGAIWCMNAPLYSINGSCVVDYVAKYESLGEELGRIGQFIGTSVPLASVQRLKRSDAHERARLSELLRAEYRPRMLELFWPERDTLKADSRFAEYWEDASGGLSRAARATAGRG